MLIIGGLIALGILALIGAFFVMRDPKGTGRATKPKGEIKAPQVEQTASIEEAAEPAIEQPFTATSETAAVPGSSEELTTTPLEVLPATPMPENQIKVQDQDVSEVLAELQKLHEQSAELERRLSQLTELVEHLEPTSINISNTRNKRS